MPALQAKADNRRVEQIKLYRRPGMRMLIMISGFLCMIGCAALPRGDSATLTSSRSGTTDVGGTRMHYEMAGAGQSILLIHAGIADCRMWDEQMGPLSRRHMVIRCDLRGFGGTPRGSVRFSHYRDVATLLDSLGIEMVHLVGSSFGGRVAIDFALAYPERIRSLILCAPAISGAIPSPELRDIDSTEEAFLATGDLEGAAEFNVRTWVVGPYRRPGDVSPALQQRVKEMQLHNYSLPSPTGAESVPLEPRAMTRLGDIRAKTLILIGNKDVPSFQSLSAAAAREIPHARMIVIPDVAHMINMEKPETFNRILLEYLEDR